MPAPPATYRQPMAVSITITCRMTMSLLSAGTSCTGALYATQATVSRMRTTGSTYSPTARILVNDSSTNHTRAMDQATMTSDS